MSNPTVPGVSIREISTLPASVVAVETAIPAFIGYTEKGTAMTPTRISSMVEYEQQFGSAFNETVTVNLTGISTDLADTTIELTNANTNGFSPYTLYYNMRMYFGNGGGPCWVVSIGGYDATDYTPETEDVGAGTGLIAGLKAIETIDEVTLLVIPEIQKISSPSGRAALNDAMLAQCAQLRDRFAIMDAPTTTGSSDAGTFRSGDVGTNDLKYGAAYYPYLNTAIVRKSLDTGVTLNDSRGTTTPLTHGKTLAELGTAGFTVPSETASLSFILTTPVSHHTGSVLTITIGASSETLDEGIGGSFDWDNTGNGTRADVIADIMAAQTAAKAASGTSLWHQVIISDSATTGEIVFTAAAPGIAGNSIVIDYVGGDEENHPGAQTSTPPGPLTGGANDTIVEPDTELYAAIKAKLSAGTMTLPPSAAIAGVYARIDRTRGVWKAPANTSLDLVTSVAKALTDADQAGFNVDTTTGTGKSINCIRYFHGKGNLVWGARTLAGNDNEWRYVPVRRLYNMAEESIKKATEFVVFEPNDANTWTRTKAMIENFLNNLWRQGALAGPTPESAYFVNVGLGATMTTQDILEGRMIIEIGMAAVRPAEFIILKFSHKLQEA